MYRRCLTSDLPVQTNVDRKGQVIRMTHILALQVLRSQDDDISFPCFSIYDSTIGFRAMTEDGS